ESPYASRRVNTRCDTRRPLRHVDGLCVERLDMLESAPMTTPIQLTMPLEDAMQTQRAIRRLKPDPVDDALVLHLIELALKAPTGSNAQNWEFIVVKDRVVKAKLGQMNRRAFSLYGAIGRRMVERSGDQRMLKIINAVQWQADHFEEVTVIVVA